MWFGHGGMGSEASIAWGEEWSSCWSSCLRRVLSKLVFSVWGPFKVNRAAASWYVGVELVWHGRWLVFYMCVSFMEVLSAGMRGIVVVGVVWLCLLYRWNIYSWPFGERRTKLDKRRWLVRPSLSGKYFCRSVQVVGMVPHGHGLIHWCSKMPMDKSICRCCGIEWSPLSGRLSFLWYTI